MRKRPSPRFNEAQNRALVEKFQVNARELVETYEARGHDGKTYQLNLFVSDRGSEWIYWTLSADGRRVGIGTLVAHDAPEPHLEIGTSVILRDARGQGLYGEVLRRLLAYFKRPVVSDTSLTSNAIRAWKRAGGKLEYWQGDVRYVLQR